jgi:hypothetical protein
LANVLAALIIAASAPAALGTTAADLCDPSSEPCIVGGEQAIDDGSVIDVGSRELRITGQLDVGSGAMTLRARRLDVQGRLLARGGPTGAGGAIIVLADTVLVDGTIDATGARGGSVDLTANGELTVHAAVAADASSSVGYGGIITFTGAVVVVNAAVTARGGADGTGGVIEIRSDAEASIAGQLDASGGEGGSVDITAGGGTAGGLTIAVGARVIADALCKGCDGGVITLMAGGPDNPLAVVAVDGQLRATGLDGHRDEVGGSGGNVAISATRDLRTGVFSFIGVRGGAPDGFGGDVSLVGGGAVRIGGEIDVGANGRASLAGALRAEAGAEVEITGVIRARAYFGGDVEITAAGGSLAIGPKADIDTRASTSAAGGDVTIGANGDLKVDGIVQSDGGSGPEGAGGLNDLSGCLVEIGPKAVLRSRGKGGTNVLRGRNDVIVAGTLRADPDAGRNEIRYPSLQRVPVYLNGAVVDPPAEEVVDPTLRPCRPTRPPTPTPRDTSTPPATPTRTPRPACPGDCDGDGMVTVEEVVLGTNVGLDLLPLGRCTAMDANGDGLVMVNELIAAVLAGLVGCGV